MSGTGMPLRCQVGDCGNRGALTVTVELPTEWSESRAYNVATLQVAACGDCARDLEGHASTLLAARVQYGRLREKLEDGARMRTQLVGLVEAVGAPFEPVHGSVFGRWLAALDKPAAQAAWRLLADVKRRAVGSGRVRFDLEPGPRDSQASAPVRIDDSRFRRGVPVPPTEPVSPRPAAPRPDRRPRGGDDAA